MTAAGSAGAPHMHTCVVAAPINGSTDAAADAEGSAQGGQRSAQAEPFEHTSAQTAHDDAVLFERTAADVPAIDLIGAILVVLLSALGFWRGLWWQAMRFAGLAGAVLVARAFTPRLAPDLETRLVDLDPRFLTGLVWLVLFLAALGVAAALGRLGRRLLEAMQLGLMDRVAGGLFGALTGLLLHAALVAAVLQLAPHQLAHHAVAGTRSERLVSALERPLPLLFDAHTSRRMRALLAAPPGTTPVDDGVTAPASAGGNALQNGPGALHVAPPAADHDGAGSRVR